MNTRPNFAGKYFEPLLEYLRSGELHIPPNMDIEAVVRLANFLLLELPAGLVGKQRMKIEHQSTVCLCVVCTGTLIG
jgi:hypothetical protein